MTDAREVESCGKEADGFDTVSCGATVVENAPPAA